MTRPPTWPSWGARRDCVKTIEHRYWLHMTLNGRKGVTVFCMLNPSLANKQRNDPTSRRCIDFATIWESERVVLVNLYAAISTDPDELMEHDNPQGHHNVDYIRHACRMVGAHGGRFVVAWGAHSLARLQGPPTIDLIRSCGVAPMHLGLTKEGQPRHPLYVPSTQELAVYGR